MSSFVNTDGVHVFASNGSGDVVFGLTGTLPSGSGYGPGCILLMGGTLYYNSGDATTASFNNVNSISSAEIEAGAVGLTALSTGVAPSHVVKFAGQHTTAGGDANESATVTGALATDIAIASIEDNGTNNVTLLQTAAAADAVNFTMSADPSTDCIINYMVLRAAS